MSRDTLQNTQHNADHLHATIFAMKQRFHEYRMRLHRYYTTIFNRLRFHLEQPTDTAQSVADHLDAIICNIEVVREEIPKVASLVISINEAQKLCEEYADDPEMVEMVEDRIRRTLDEVTGEQST
ncbi:hypothetical protein AWENTII_009280 [Aspergillus wentii]